MSDTYLPSGAIGRPRTDREPVTIRIGRKQRKWIDGHALREQCGRSEIIRRLIRDAMDAEADVHAAREAELSRCE